jgi:hypothetical protein
MMTTNEPTGQAADPCTDPEQCTWACLSRNDHDGEHFMGYSMPSRTRLLCRIQELETELAKRPELPEWDEMVKRAIADADEGPDLYELSPSGEPVKVKNSYIVEDVLRAALGVTDGE